MNKKLEEIKNTNACLYEREIFELNPDGVHVTPWCNKGSFEEAYQDGFNAGVKELWPLVEAMHACKDPKEYRGRYENMTLRQVSVEALKQVGELDEQTR